MADGLFRRIRGIIGGGGEPEPPPAAASFAAGDWVVVSGLGPRRVLEAGADGNVVFADTDRDASPVRLPPAEAQRRLRPLVDVATARELRQSLAVPGSPDLTEDDYDRGLEYRRVLKSNDLRRMTETLRGIYRHPHPGYPEEQALASLEEAVHGELGRVLGVKPGVLRREAHAAGGSAAAPSDRSEEAAAHEPPPAVPGYEAIGAFHVERSLVLGEDCEGVELPARPGVWLAYFLDLESCDDEEEDRQGELLVLHADVLERVAELRATATRVEGELPIDGASMAAVDGDAARDPSFRKELQYAGHEIVGNRGVQARMDGDGHAVARVARRDGVAELAFLELY